VGVSPDATVDNFAILAALSGKAAESAATRFSPDELAQLERVAETLDGSESGDPMIHANSQFHRVINEAARSQQLLSLIRQAVRLIPFDFLAVLPVHDNTGHREPLRDVRAGRAQPAREAAERHVLAAGKSLADWLHRPPHTADCRIRHCLTRLAQFVLIGTTGSLPRPQRGARSPPRTSSTVPRGCARRAPPPGP
jgi:DNA-binding GntR family transcriptional regulator